MLDSSKQKKKYVAKNMAQINTVIILSKYCIKGKSKMCYERRDTRQIPKVAIIIKSQGQEVKY
jgi:hypothetical protein